MIFKINGLVAATHTPFTNDGDLNLGVIEKQAEHLSEKGVRTVFIAGTTGECHSLTVEERLNLAERWAKVTRRSTIQLVVHVGANCLADAQQLATHAEKVGAVAIAALSPSYFKPPTVSALVETTRQIASAAPNTPFYFYDIPSLTGVTLPMIDYLAQAGEKIPTLAGLKFTNIDAIMYQLCRSFENGRFDILWGTDEILLAALALGAEGFIGSTYNFAAPIYHRIIASWEKGDLETARQEQLQSVKLVRTLSKRGYMASAKFLMQRLGVNVGPPRLPNPSLSPEQEKELLTELEPFESILKG